MCCAMLPISSFIVFTKPMAADNYATTSGQKSPSTELLGREDTMEGAHFWHRISAAFRVYGNGVAMVLMVVAE